ncbi:MAG: hypothetical protein MR598_03405 [Erysipelotrichaceae bacterium]|nr:hypothetical protein [Erysipelotrichaceae bacterium]
MNFIKEYWVQIIFLLGIATTFLTFCRSMIEATKCSLRNDILDIYDRCKDKKQITHYQLESIKYSSDLYFKLKGNSFVKNVVDRVNDFDLID